MWGAILSFNVGKWIPSIGAFARVLLLVFFSISVLIYAIKHGVHGFGAGSFKPSYAVFIAAVPVLFFNFVGFELPNAAGEEMINAKRDIPFTIIRAAGASILLYGIPVLMILLVLPTGQVTNLGGFIDAMKTVFTVYGGSVAADGTPTLTGAGHVLGDIAALGFIWVLMSSGATWIMGADRTQAVAGYDGAAPRVFGVFSKRWGTPIVVNLLSGVVATLVMIFASVLTSGSSEKYFSAVLGLAISTTTISYILIFPTVVKLRYSHAHVPRPFKIPGGIVMVWVVGVLCTGWALLATVVLLWPGLGTSNPNDALDGLGFSNQRWQYEACGVHPARRDPRGGRDLLCAGCTDAQTHGDGPPGRARAGAGLAHPGEVPRAGCPLRHRHVVALARSQVHLERAGDLLLRVGQQLEPLREPAGGARDREHDREHRHGQPERLVDQPGVEVDVRVQLPRDEVVVLERDLLELERDVEQRVAPGDLEHLVGGLA